MIFKQTISMLRMRANKSALLKKRSKEDLGEENMNLIRMQMEGSEVETESLMKKEKSRR